jgi:hypothetical protein
LLNAPALVSSFAPEASLLLINPLCVGLALDAIEVTSTRNASIELDSAPNQQSDEGASPQSTGANLVSMFQTNSLGLRAEIMVNWSVASSAINVLDMSIWSGGSP